MSDEDDEADFDLQGDANLQQVMRAHLLTERKLYALLTEALVVPGVLDLDRMTFAAKCRLAAAMGLYVPEVMSALLALNKLRNNFAHDAKYRFEEQSKLELINSLPDAVVSVILTEDDGSKSYTRENIPLERLLKRFVALMEARRRDFVQAREEHKEAMDRLKKAVEKARGVH